MILSAKHGVLTSRDRLRAYDQTLSKMTKAQRSEWRKGVNQYVKEHVLAEGKTPVYVCGSLYYESLPGIPLLPRTSMVKQMQWMRNVIASTTQHRLI